MTNRSCQRATPLARSFAGPPTRMEMESLPDAGTNATIDATKDERGINGMMQKLNLRINSKAPRKARGAVRNEDCPCAPPKGAMPAAAIKKRASGRGGHFGAFNVDDDPHDLYGRFVTNHALMFPTALWEVQSGWKESCWSWFILPCAPYRVGGVERGSAMNRRYALRGDGAVVAYLECECAYPYPRLDPNIDRRISEDEARLETKWISLRDNYVAILAAIVRQLESGNTLDNLLGSTDAVKAVSSFELFHRIARDVTNDAELEGLCRRVLELGSRRRDRRHGPNWGPGRTASDSTLY